MKNPTNGDSIELKIMNFIEANKKIQAVEAVRAALDMKVRDQLLNGEAPCIKIKVNDTVRDNNIENVK